MAYQNRVDPWGDLVATSVRGTLMGNRGILIDEHRQIVRRYQTRRWIACLLSFKGRHREVMTPGTYTELFFLDEATAFAAGHRPCAECQHARYQEFRRAWLTANPGRVASDARIEAIDDILHQERYAGGHKVTYQARRADLPDGVFFAYAGNAYLVHNGETFLWSFTGYTKADAHSFPDEVDVLTPHSIVKTFNSGFRPLIHDSAAK
jgi:hypothetical protein